MNTFFVLVGKMATEVSKGRNRRVNDANSRTQPLWLGLIPFFFLFINLFIFVEIRTIIHYQIHFSSHIFHVYHSILGVVRWTLINPDSSRVNSLGGEILMM